MMIDGTTLAGVAAIITALGLIIVQVLTLLVARNTNKKADEIHVQTNSNAQAMDARLEQALAELGALREQAAADRGLATAATLVASERAIATARAAQPPKEGSGS